MYPSKRTQSSLSNRSSRSNTSAGYSADTQALLSSMMSKTDLTAFQKRLLLETAKKGKSLPVSCHPDTSYYERSGSSLSSGTGVYTLEDFDHKPKVLNPTNTKSKGIKTLCSILKDTPYERDSWKPSPVKVNPEKERRALQNIMAFGDPCEKKELSTRDKIKKLREKMEEPIPEIDEFEEISREIDERKEFLEEMTELGLRSKYEAKIMSEINLRLTQLRIIDQKRNKELEALEKKYEEVKRRKIHNGSNGGF